MFLKKTTLVKIANLIIVAGALVVLYPLLDRAFTWYWQQKIFNEWQNSPASADASLSGSEPDEETSGDVESSEDNSRELFIVEPVGILQIKKINLKLPILRGSSMLNLKIGAGLLENTAEIGAPGNTVLTAHRSYTYGRFFNRLDEVEMGDEIVITAGRKRTLYGLQQGDRGAG